MNDALFWQLIDRLGHDLQPTRLLMALTALPAAQVLGFGWHLRQAADVLDTPAHRAFAAGAREHELSNPGRPALTARQAPDLHELRLTVVALGRDVWQSVAATPCLLQASWPCDLGRQVEALAVRPTLSREDLVRGA